MNLHYTTFFREGNAGDGGGGPAPLPPSAKDIMGGVPQGPPAPNPDKPAPAPAPTPDPNKPAPAPAPVEGVKADGTLEDGYIKDAAGVVIKDPNYVAPAPGADEPDPESAEAFYGTVQKLTGTTLEVNYPDGVDALSPEGVAVREQALLQYGAEQFENYLAQKDPRGYAYLTHRANGGTDEEFLGNDRGGYTLPDLAAVEASADLQKQLYLQDLTIKGIDTDQAQILVEDAIKKNQLLTKAQAAHKTIDTLQKNQLLEQQKIQKAEQQKIDTAVGTINTALDKAIDTEIGFTIPPTEKPAFKQFVMQRLEYDNVNDKYMIVQELPKDNIKLYLESLLFQFKKGDLSTLVQKQAQAKAVQRLRVQADKAGKKQPNGIDDTAATHLPLTLNQVMRPS